MIRFNTYTIDVLMYGAPMYGNSFVFPNLSNQVGGVVWVLIFVHFLIAHYYFLMHYITVKFGKSYFIFGCVYLLVIVYLS